MLLAPQHTLHAHFVPFGRQAWFYGEPRVARFDAAEIFDDGPEHPTRRAGDPAGDRIARAPIVGTEILVGERVGFAAGNTGRMVRVVGHYFAPASQRLLGPACDDVGDNFECCAVAIRCPIFIHAGQEHGDASHIFVRAGIGRREGQRTVLRLEDFVDGFEAFLFPLAGGKTGKHRPRLGI